MHHKEGITERREREDTEVSWNRVKRKGRECNFCC